MRFATNGASAPGCEADPDSLEMELERKVKALLEMLDPRLLALCSLSKSPE